MRLLFLLGRPTPDYFKLARAVGTAMAGRGQTLIYGGGRVGLMGQLARAVHAGGGRVVGVIPEALREVELAYTEADELIVTQTMRQRKQLMDERADAFLILPGGFGTLEELVEVLVLRILKYHDRPIVVLNHEGFYDKLDALFEHFIAEGFAKDKHRALYTLAPTPEAAFEHLDHAMANRPAKPKL